MNSIFNEQISINLVEDLIYSYEGAAHLKDLSSGKNVLGNLANARKFGLSKPEDVYGLTVRDLDLHMNKYWGNHASEIENFDNQIKYSKKLVIDRNRVFLTPSGDIFVHHMKKYPIITSQNQVCAVLTLNQNITKEISMIQLWYMYKNLSQFHTKKSTINNFLIYLKIKQFFYEPPTETELIVMITKQLKATVKDIAIHLDLSPRTIETHLSNLKAKLKIELNSILHMF